LKFRELPLTLKTTGAARLNVDLLQCEFSDVYKNGPSTKAWAPDPTGNRILGLGLPRLLSKILCGIPR
jgi:hypothetical protein